MIAAAVNCLLQEAKRKLVCASIFANVRSSRAPYPRSKIVRPPLRTKTAAPGDLPFASGAKMRSIAAAMSSCANARIRSDMRTQESPRTKPNILRSTRDLPAAAYHSRIASLASALRMQGRRSAGSLAFWHGGRGKRVGDTPEVLDGDEN